MRSSDPTLGAAFNPPDQHAIPVLQRRHFRRDHRVWETSRDDLAGLQDEAIAGPPLSSTGRPG